MDTALLRKTIKENNCNFIAFAQTPWHAHGINAFLVYAKENNINIKGYICILKHSQAGILIGRNNFINCTGDVEVVLFTDIGSRNKRNPIKSRFDTWSWINKSKEANEKNACYILSPFMPKYDWHAYMKSLNTMKVYSVIIDEGLAMYMRSLSDWKNETWSSPISLKSKLKNTYEVLFRNESYQKKLNKRSELMQFTLFSNDGTLSKNTDVIEHYKTAIAYTSELSSYDDIKCFENAAIINTQPYYDHGQISEDEDIRVLKWLCLKLSELNIKVVLKPHPREKNLLRYSNLVNCYLYENNVISQETILSHLKIKPILFAGFSSTSLVTANILYGIPAISLSRLTNSEKIGNQMKSDDERFVSTFGDLVFCPSNGYELSNTLKEIV